VNFVSRAAGPHLLFIARRDGGPPARVELGAPDQGAGMRWPIGPVGIRWAREIKSNSLPLDLTLYYSFTFTFSRFVIDLCIEHASSSRSPVDGFSSYNSRFYSETDSLTFGPL
jgi:hypothetical protein